jgi:hypothetical protein
MLALQQSHLNTLAPDLLKQLLEQLRLLKPSVPVLGIYRSSASEEHRSLRDSPLASPSLDMALVPVQERARFAYEGVVHLLRRQLARRQR